MRGSFDENEIKPKKLVEIMPIIDRDLTNAF